MKTNVATMVTVSGLIYVNVIQLGTRVMSRPNATYSILSPLMRTVLKETMKSASSVIMSTILTRRRSCVTSAARHMTRCALSAITHSVSNVSGHTR